MDVLVVRIFGPHGLIDRKAEFLGLQIIHAIGYGTPIIAIFTNGLVVGYARGCMLKYQDLFDPKIMK